MLGMEYGGASIMPKSTPECRKGCDIIGALMDESAKRLKALDVLEAEVKTLREDNRQRAALELDATATIKALKTEVAQMKTVTDLIADGGVDALIEHNRKLRAAMGHADAALANWEPEFCGWKHDEFQDMYETECGEAFCFPDGNWRDNHYEHCPKCGKEIVERIEK